VPGRQGFKTPRTPSGPDLETTPRHFIRDVGYSFVPLSHNENESGFEVA
jgi:hypothetical protein